MTYSHGEPVPRATANPDKTPWRYIAVHEYNLCPTRFAHESHARHDTGEKKKRNAAILADLATLTEGNVRQKFCILAERHGVSASAVSKVVYRRAQKSKGG